MIKLLVLFILLIMNISCDVGSKKESKEQNKRKEGDAQNELRIEGEEDIDSDFDGIGDKQEVELNQDPFVSEIPFVGIFEVSSLNLSSIFHNRDNLNKM